MLLEAARGDTRPPDFDCEGQLRQILQALWGGGHDGEEAHYVWIYVSRVRHEIETDPELPQYLLMASITDCERLSEPAPAMLRATQHSCHTAEHCNADYGRFEGVVCILHFVLVGTKQVELRNKTPNRAGVSIALALGSLLTLAAGCSANNAGLATAAPTEATISEAPPCLPLVRQVEPRQLASGRA